MSTSSIISTTSRSTTARLVLGSFLALALAACGGTEDFAETAKSAATPESAPALAANEAQVAPGEKQHDKARGERGERGERGKRGLKDPAKMVERFDANGDGKLALAELPERAQDRFADADANKDGFLSGDEIKARMEQHAGKDGERFAKRGKGGKSPEARFAKKDTNGDGFLTADEVGERWDHMKVADANNDAKLTKDELAEARAAGKLKGHKGERKDPKAAPPSR